MSARRTEPTAALCPAPGQARMAYTDKDHTDIRATLGKERARIAHEQAFGLQAKPATAPAPVDWGVS